MRGHAVNRAGRHAEDFVAAMAAASAEIAARARTSRRWALTAERESATFAGVLMGLVGRQVGVEVWVAGGAMWSGTITAASIDTVTLDREGRRCVIRTASIERVSASQEFPAADGDGRTTGADRVSLDEVARLLVDTGIEATFSVAGGGSVSGLVAWSGADALVIGPAGPPDRTRPESWHLVRMASVVAIAWHGR